MSRLILDAGAFIAFEKGDVGVRSRLAAARRLGVEIATTSPVVGQVWRDGRRQALLAILVSATLVVPPDTAAARRAGELLAASKKSDVVDALLAGLARDGDTILTRDASDIRALLAAARTRATVVTV
jgi:predicted nucleic acid-binding protein